MRVRKGRCFCFSLLATCFLFGAIGPCSKGKHLRALTEGPSPPEGLRNGTFHFFSALHDVTHGEVRVIAEVYPEGVCESLHTCLFKSREGGEKLTVAASDHVFLKPYWNPVQLRECFLLCKLPRDGMQLATITLMDRDGKPVGTKALEEVPLLPEGREKGVGICHGPLISDVPTASDWLTYYTELGVDGIHLYVVAAQFLFDSEYIDKIWHNPASHKSVNMHKHHLVTWRKYHPPSHYSAHYYGQRLMENDCIFRHRNIYEYIIMPDQDEFLHFPGKRLREVNLLHTFRDIFGSSNYASATYYGAQYHIHCYTVEASDLNAEELPDGQEKESKQAAHLEYPTYDGHDVWSDSGPKPNFSVCHHVGDCLPKYVLRPFAIDVAGVHQVRRVMPGYQWTMEVSPDVVYTKHLRCVTAPGGNAWETDRTAPLCNEKEVLDPESDDQKRSGVPVCPDDFAASV